MSDESLDGLQEELDSWRARIERLRVQASLGRMEARDRWNELGEALDPAWQRARRTLDEVASSGKREARALGQSLLAGWEELRRTHRRLAREAELERSPPRDR